MPFEIFEHTADQGLRIWASSRNSLFADAAAGLFSLIVPDLASIRLSETRLLQLGSESLDYLLFDWLNELLYLYEVQHLLLARFDVEVTDEGLAAQVHGEPIDHNRHVLDHEVKAITYHGLKLERSANLWLAEVIVDI
jgi:SHS2 domain-containing protein